ncbi:WAS/WASL-interacting protein family member 3-like [Meles meles]|uniref:WAS/WASL-interacting protein family member 3-like n=1 Tax=Meles meles TaxID=9662 RepID=UPI001E699EA4|nr:WAS/WASL-interacting protein family member 3-like [Meles meles]
MLLNLTTPEGDTGDQLAGVREPRRSQSRRDHPRTPRLAAASQLSPHIWLAPSTVFRIWSQSARGALGGESVRVTCGGAEPSAGSVSRPRSLRPFSPARYPAGDSAGHRRARPAAAPGASRREARPGYPTEELSRLPAPARVRLSRAGSFASSAGPRTAEVGLAPPRGGNRPPPFLPPASSAGPGGGRVSSRPSPAPAKVKLSRWRSFLAGSARSQLPQPGQFEVSTAGDKRVRVSPSWCSRGERQQARRTPGAPFRAHSAHPRALPEGKARRPVPSLSHG